MRNLIRFLFILSFFLSYQGIAQKKEKPKRPLNPNQKFLQTQFWIGLKGGPNLTKANPTAFYSTFSGLDFADAELEKDYDNFKTLGSQVGLEFVFYHRGFSVAFFPNYARFNFTYHNSYTYESLSNSADQVILNYDQKNHLEYIDLPLMFKYDILQEKLRPFVQIGAYYSRLLNASKEVTIENNDMASGAVQPYQPPAIIVGAKDIFIGSSLGLMAGVGVHYDPGNIRLSMDINYRYGLNNIASAENRYRDNRLASSGDALDDLTLDNLTMNVGVFFPMRFISKSFNSDF
ncbi:MAG: outer membrane beta-barrel protein [Reichenbachiella sp.]|uniref:outer membrane beta-barrel protein n=1 Tax=Reichenbachiella sp. TaxID=2184521 RepID=UPI003265F075